VAEEHLLAGKYQLLRRIAQGGMAEVWLARQRGLEGFEKLVVIKRILPHLVESDEFVSMFLDEARTAADLRHPNVVQIYEIGEDQGTYFIAMEFLHGQDIRRVMRRQAEAGGRVPLNHALQIVMDAGMGLDHAHKKSDLAGRPLNIIHRDISPQNIIVTYDGTTKIVDFGIAKAASQSTHTASGVLKGKYSYMSPEQASGEVLDQRTDQFALGIVLYELVTMTRLFKHASEILTLHAVTECRVKPPHEVLPGLPQGLSAIVMRALSKRREDRYEDCQGLVMALEEFMAEGRLVHSPSRLSVYVRELFKDTLEQEKSLGQPVVLSETGESGAIPGPATAQQRRATQGSQSSGRRPGADQEATRARPGRVATGTGNPSGRTPAPGPLSAAEEADMQEARTQVTAAGPNALPPGASSQEEFHTAPTEATGVQAAAGHGGAVRGHSAVDTAVRQASRPGGARRLFLMGLGLSAVMAGLAGGALWVLRGPATAAVVVRSTPSGATLTVDGQPHKEPTPTVLADLEVGRTYALRAELRGYAPGVTSVVVAQGGGQEVSLTLERDIPRTLLVLSSTPPGARVFLDGNPLEGVSPIRISVPSDKDQHVVTFSLEGHGDETRRFSLKDVRVEVAATLSALDAEEGRARLNITSTPPGAIIVVGGKPVGTAPLAGVLVTGGKAHTVAARLPGFEPQERLVDADKNATVDVAFELEKERTESGFLTLESDVDAQVFTDKGKLLGSTPLRRVKLPAGTLTLRLVNDKKGLDYPEKVTITADREETRTVKVPSGRIKVVVESWADVYVDGIKVGTTPMAPRKVYAGRHEVRLVNSKLAKDEKVVVQVQANQDERIKRNW
jgi:serine/threonine protein kinase